MIDAIFDDIVSGFYRAASGAIDWGSALRPFQTALSAFAIYLHGIDTAKGRIAFSHVAMDIGPECELDYVRRYHPIDPRIQLMANQGVGVWMNCWEHFDEAFVARDRFYQEFLIPYGGRYVSGAKLLETGGTDVFLGVHRGFGGGVLNASEIAVCQRLARHLTDALVVHGQTQRQHRSSRLGTALLSRLRAPVALIDEERRLHHLNPAAEALLGRSTALTRRGGRLYCTLAEQDQALWLGLRRLLRPGPRIEPKADKLFLNAGAGDGEPATGLYVEALCPDDTLHAFGDQALAMLLLHEPGRHVEVDPFIVASAFDLTPAEARVAAAAAAGASPEEIASRHQVSLHTVRSQLRSIFEKTGVSRQAELVSLLAALPTADWSARQEGASA